MELVSSVLVVGVKQCQYSVSFTGGPSEYRSRRNPVQVLFSSADGMIDSLKNMEIVQEGTGYNKPAIIRCKFVIGADHVKRGKLDQEELMKELII